MGIAGPVSAQAQVAGEPRTGCLGASSQGDRQKTGKQTITLTDHVILSAKDTEKRDESENEWVGGRL